MTRPARCIALTSVALALAVGATGCSTRTRVELESAGEPRDGVSVIEAGAVVTEPVGAGGPTSTTTEVPASTASTTTTVATTPTSTVQTVPVDAEATAEQCATERARLRAAIDSYVAEYSMSPLSEAELVATMHLRTTSLLYDIRIDGSIRATDDTCARSG